MNKTGLSAKVAEITGTSNIKAVAAVKAVFEAIAESLANGEAVLIANFGKFIPFQSKPRKGYNPTTGENIDIAAKTIAKFRPAKV